MIEADLTKVRVVTASEVLRYGTADLALTAARVAADVRRQPDSAVKRLNLALPGGWMRVLAATLPSLGVFGYKEFHYSPGGVLRYAIHLFSTDDGRPLGVVDASLITTMRTAASAAAAATAYLGEPGRPLTVGVIGSGAEARAGLRALASTLPVKVAHVTSRQEANRVAFAEEMSQELEIAVLPVASPEAAANDVDVVYLATGSRHVVVGAADLADVPLVLSIGSTMPDQRELPGAVLTGASVLVVDTPDVLEESGDALEAVALGLDRSRVRTLGDYIAEPGGQAAGTTLYKSIGSPEQDLVLAKAIIDAMDAVGGDGRVIESLTDIKRNL
ncbi:ornithine cyclodeaminase [Nocardioides sp. LHG3406-4]|uniref:ornithine cyclodeaminase n=1 Tax=Nocardioides sp. LHG3406-4 TaxID=2804575 RepID=UPI003CFACF3B